LSKAAQTLLMSSEVLWAVAEERPKERGWERRRGVPEVKIVNKSGERMFRRDNTDTLVRRGGGEQWRRAVEDSGREQWRRAVEESATPPETLV
jgi:hypothetical protein